MSQKDIDYPERPRTVLKDIDYPERPRGDGQKNNLLEADVVDRSTNLEAKKVIISFATDPTNQKTLIYKIDTGAQTFYVQLKTNRKLSDSALKEIAYRAAKEPLATTSINDYLKKQNTKQKINGNVIDTTDDITKLEYKMPQTFPVNQQIGAQQTNLNIAAVSLQLKMG